MKLLITVTSLLFAVHAGSAGAANGPTARAALAELRHVVYDAMYRNDAENLQRAISSLDRLAATASGHDRASVDYYASLAYWALSASQLQADDAAGALASGKSAVTHARAGVKARPDDPEFYALLANALIVVAILDPPNFMATAKELAPIRTRALELGPRNPRVVVMDAGLIFNNPPSRGGGRQKGLERWREALALFDREAAAATADALAPRWGHALAWGWHANMLLGMGEDYRDRAREAAVTALQMRPDFWYVREQVMPKLR